MNKALLKITVQDQVIVPTSSKANLKIEFTNIEAASKVAVPHTVYGVGPQGEQGEPGVWYGIDPPPNDDYTVWIRPDGSKYENGIWLGPGPVPEGYNVWINPQGSPTEDFLLKADIHILTNQEIHDLLIKE